MNEYKLYLHLDKMKHLTQCSFNQIRIVLIKYLKYIAGWSPEHSGEARWAVRIELFN
jgi:hypothetical protein